MVSLVRIFLEVTEYDAIKNDYKLMTISPQEAWLKTCG